jgi:hypothetical protein
MKSWEYQEAIFASNLSYKAKLVGLAISYYYNWKEASPSFPSIETLTERTSLSRATVHRAKLELVSQGYLVQQRKYDQSNRYLPQIPGMSHTETTLVSQGRTNNEVNYEVNNDKDRLESSFQSDSNTVILKDIITEEIKEIEDDPAAWTEEQRRAWFLTQDFGSNREPGKVHTVSTRDNKYLKAVPGFLQELAEAGKDEW